MTEAPGTDNPQFLPPDIPVPRDDGAARHLTGMKLPDLGLPATDGQSVNLSKLKGRTVIYIYPRTGVPGVDPPNGWDQIPGARGCTPQSCSFRDHFGELRRLGVAQLYGLSTQDTAYQQGAASRLHLPFPLLSDEKLALTQALKLPTFSTAGVRLSSSAWRSSSTTAQSPRFSIRFFRLTRAQMKWSPGFNDPGKRRTFLKTVKIEEARGTRLQSVRSPLSGVKRTWLLRRKCLLLTQSGHLWFG